MAKKTSSTPVPLLKKGKAVDWWFAYKFNGVTNPGCAGSAKRSTRFGGTVQNKTPWSLQYCFASSDNPTLKAGAQCLGDSLQDPLGATFAGIYEGSCNYVVWNDQFYKLPKLKAAEGRTYAEGPWGHSKGILAWNDRGEGVVLQVTTPSWPAAGSKENPRKGDGNTLGAIASDNNIEVAQHFFALRLNAADLVQVLNALTVSSIVTNPRMRQLCKNGGPAEVQKLVRGLGKLNKGKKIFDATLSGGVRLIAKPSNLVVPPWSLVSAQLGALPLRVASWWGTDKIYSTTSRTKLGCWDASLPKPGPVEIATTGKWKGREIGLTEKSETEADGDETGESHAKIGVSKDQTRTLTIFGDMNQAGTAKPRDGFPCKTSQNYRGGTFFVLDNSRLWKSVSALLKGESEPISGPLAQPKKKSATKTSTATKKTPSRAAPKKKAVRKKTAKKAMPTRQAAMKK